MKPKHIRWFFIGLLGLLLFVSIVLPEPRTLGISAAWTNGNYRFAGGTEPGALAFAALFIVFYLALMHAAPPELGEPLPGVLRRFFAFWLDFIIAMIAAGPILGILATVVEWRRTGVFEWFFERETPAPGDMLLRSYSILRYR
jgi:hypothetical protein